MQSSAFPGAPDPDDFEIVFDPPKDLEPDAEGDAAQSDDAGPAEPPTRAAFLRNRVSEARRLLALEAAFTPPSPPPAPGLTQWQYIVEQFAPKVAATGSAALVLPSEARLGGRDAWVGATKPKLDRQAARAADPQQAGPVPKAGARARAFAELLRRAAFHGDADHACVRNCEVRLGKMTKEQLRREIAWRGASEIPDRMLRDSFTKVGLVALLCSAQCDGSAKSEAASKRSAGSGARHAPPRQGPPPPTRSD